jgi:hypothetical protein
MVADKKDEKKDPIKEISVLAPAGLAGMLIHDRGQLNMYCAPLMRTQYEMARKSGDPWVNGASSYYEQLFSDHAASVNSGGGAHHAFISLVDSLSDKYNKEFSQLTVGQAMSYLVASGKVKLPEKLQALVGAYSGKKISELKEKDEKEKKVLGIVSLLQRQSLMGSLLPQLMTTVEAGQTKATLEHLAEAA